MRANWSLAVLASAVTALATPNFDGNWKHASPAVTTVYAEGERTVTHYTTIFATVCTETDRWTSQGTVFSSTYETLSTTSSVIHHTGSPASSQAGAVGGAAGSPTAPADHHHPGWPKAPQYAAGWGKPSFTSYTRVYATVVPHEYTIVSGSSTIASSLYSPTTITTLVTETLSPVAGSSIADAVGGVSTALKSLGSEKAPAANHAPSNGSSTANAVGGAAQDSQSSSVADAASAGQASSLLQYGTIPLTYTTPSAAETSIASAVKSGADSNSTASSGQASSALQYGSIALTYTTSTAAETSVASAVESGTDSSPTASFDQASSPLQYGSIPLTYTTSTAAETSVASAVESSAESSPLYYGTIPLTDAIASLTSSDSLTASGVTSPEEGASLTSYTTTYTTAHPGTSTIHLNGTKSNTTSTFVSHTTVTTVITTKVSAIASASVSPVTVSFGTAFYTVPANDTGSGTIFAPFPVSTGSSSSSSAVLAPIGTASSGSPSMSFTSSSSAASAPIYTGSSASLSMNISASGSAASAPVSTGSSASLSTSISASSSAALAPSSTGSSANGSMSSIASSASYPMGTGSSSADSASSSSIVPPFPIGTGSSASVSQGSSSSGPSHPVGTGSSSSSGIAPPFPIGTGSPSSLSMGSSSTGASQTLGAGSSSGASSSGSKIIPPFPMGTGSSASISMGGSSTGPSQPIGTGPSSGASSSSSKIVPPFPIGTGASSSVMLPGTGSASSSFSTAPFPIGTGASSSVVLPGTGSASSSSLTAPFPIGTGPSSSVVLSGTGLASSSSLTAPFPIGTGPSSSVVLSGTGFASSSSLTAPFPIGTGPSSSVVLSGTGSALSRSSTAPFPFGTGASSSNVLPGTGPASSRSSTAPFPIGTGLSSSIVLPGTGSASSRSSTAPFPIGTGSAPSFPHPTASSSSSSSYAFNATSSSIYAPTAPITASASSSSASYPSGNSTTSAPIGSGTGVSSTKTTSASNTTTACTHKPTSTDFCIPCDGQPGSDPNNFCGYTAADNSYEVMPKTCRTVEYFFEMTNQTVAPDGVERMGLVINGQMPGPLIEANWGDTIVVHITNKMLDNGTSLHFHGIRQNYTNEMDGVASITQCALAPGESMTYTFKASNYGTSWYHSHFALQTYEGIFGPMKIAGPHSADFDVDAGHIILQDWSHNTADSMYDAAQTVGPSPQNGPRTLDTGLINGMNVWGSDNSTNQTGSRFEMEFEPQKTYLLRVVNTAIQSTFKFHIDGHKFTVISMDFVPIVPYETDFLNINIGQRYNILVKADAVPGNYWMRSDNQQACAQLTNSRDIKGIVHYSGFTGKPTSAAKAYTDECIDEPYDKLVPYAPMTAGPEDSEIHKTVVIGAGSAEPTLFKWTLDGTTFQSQWGDGTLPSISKNGSVPNYSGNLAIEVPNLHEWVYVIVESPIPLPHPIHLHGHDFFVLAQGTGAYSDSVALNTNNPPRRDVALMPWDPSAGTGGYLVLAFETDNPGAWLMHCHIGWHTSMGFALQIIENLENISKTVTDSCQLDNTCLSWNKYATANSIVVEDSGV